MTLEEIKAWLEANKEDTDVKSYLVELSAVSADKVKGFLDTEEGKKIVQPRLDAHFTKSLDTWKTNNLETIIEAEVNKRNPQKSPEQIKIEELTRKIEDAEKARNRESLVNKALKVADEKTLPKGIIDFFIAEDEEGTLTNLSKLEEEYTKALQAAVDSKFGEYGRDIEQSNNQQSGNFDIGSIAAEASIRK
ncbi:DUF4355 domain-containing protein [Peribacillus simplex]|uniref:DUF4355 domain-containing protein n=1 Tax=Peribacillus simplex TaxID=1478 RepID=A0A9W4KX13_9BACI|nr:DUF4355 domain-containing protein [Peribacillus simplex]CAH0186211.1 hypothetical protein SRABI133_01550 [Peribacillus simplex]